MPAPLVIEGGHQGPDTQNGRRDDLLEANQQTHKQATVNGHQGMDSITSCGLENSNLGDQASDLQDSNDGASDGAEILSERKGRKRVMRRRHKRRSNVSLIKKRRNIGSLRLKSNITAVAQNEPPKSGLMIRGSPYVGKRVRRAIIDEEGEEIGYGKGKIVGWWPAHKSDFNSPLTGLPAPLWHLVYDEVCENEIRFAKTFPRPIAPTQSALPSKPSPDPAARRAPRRRLSPRARVACSILTGAACQSGWGRLPRRSRSARVRSIRPPSPPIRALSPMPIAGRPAEMSARL